MLLLFHPFSTGKHTDRRLLNIARLRPSDRADQHRRIQRAAPKALSQTRQTICK